ncbi:MAG: bifunctional ornithine acetyltransferase/N-acetylglutamate synthase, partial [Actinomycetes bacterium]
MTQRAAVTAALGFRAAGVAAGIKSSGARDVAMVVNDGPEFCAAAVTTTNRVKAAPVQWTEQVVRDGDIRAVVLNSGSANACTGAGGVVDTESTATLAGKLLDCEPEKIAVCSTGLIGARLPMDRLLAGVRAAASDLSEDGHADAACAILTTDTTT